MTNFPLYLGRANFEPMTPILGRNEQNSPLFHEFLHLFLEVSTRYPPVATNRVANWSPNAIYADNNEYNYSLYPSEVLAPRQFFITNDKQCVPQNTEKGPS